VTVKENAKWKKAAKRCVTVGDGKAGKRGEKKGRKLEMRGCREKKIVQVLEEA